VTSWPLSRGTVVGITRARTANSAGAEPVTRAVQPLGIKSVNVPLSKPPAGAVYVNVR